MFDVGLLYYIELTIYWEYCIEFTNYKDQVPVIFFLQDEKKAKVYGKTKKEEQAKVAIKSFEQIVKFCEVPM